MARLLSVLALVASAAVASVAAAPRRLTEGAGEAASWAPTKQHCALAGHVPAAPPKPHDPAGFWSITENKWIIASDQEKGRHVPGCDLRGLCDEQCTYRSKQPCVEGRPEGGWGRGWGRASHQRKHHRDGEAQASEGNQLYDDYAEYLTEEEAAAEEALNGQTRLRALSDGAAAANGWGGGAAPTKYWRSPFTGRAHRCGADGTFELVQRCTKMCTVPAPANTWAPPSNPVSWAPHPRPQPIVPLPAPTLAHDDSYGHGYDDHQQGGYDDRAPPTEVQPTSSEEQRKPTLLEKVKSALKGAWAWIAGKFGH